MGVKRAFGQGYHDRFILHYHPSLDLAQPWREFIDELHGPTYESLVRRLFGLRRNARFVLTLEWYYAWQGCGVSPHCDARRKLGTHIFYFNTDADWDANWGGRILIMDDGKRLKTHSAPSVRRPGRCRLARPARERQPDLPENGPFLARRAAPGVSGRPPAQAVHRHDQRAHHPGSLAACPRQGPGRFSAQVPCHPSVHSGLTR